MAKDKQPVESTENVVDELPVVTKFEIAGAEIEEVTELVSDIELLKQKVSGLRKSLALDVEGLEITWLGECENLQTKCVAALDDVRKSITARCADLKEKISACQ